MSKTVSMTITRDLLKSALYSPIFGWELIPNRFYGNNMILREYAGMKLPFYVPGEIQHGWVQGCGIDGDLSKHGKREKEFRHYVWKQANQPDTGMIQDRSLLLFPQHSIEIEPFVDPIRTYRRYLEELCELRYSLNPITVCLYWFDYQNTELTNLFRDSGITVTSLGHRDHTPDFLIRFHELTSRHNYVSSNQYATALFYALYMRKKAFVFGETFHSDIQRIPLPENPQYPKMSTVYPELLWRNFDDRSHYWIGEKELGLEFKRSPSELRSLFGWTPVSLARRAPHRLVAGPCVVAKMAAGRIKRTMSERFPPDK